MVDYSDAAHLALEYSDLVLKENGLPDHYKVVLFREVFGDMLRRQTNQEIADVMRTVHEKLEEIQSIVEGAEE
jgi:hypothetical protein